MLGSLVEPHIWTANLLVIGFVQGLIVSLVAMGIVLVYRSSRVINFAVGDLGVPAAAILAILVGKQGWPYWPGLVFAVLVGTLSGTVVEVAVIRRLSKAPRVIVLVATIGIAELAQAVVHALPDYRTGELQISYPSPMTAQWTIKSLGLGPFHAHNITITGPQLLAIIVVPLICLGLWWLLGHTTFGESVRATATNADLARLTGVSPKVMSTAIWTIAGFLSTVSVILYATLQGSSELVAIGPETLLLGLSAALIARHDVVPEGRRRSDRGRLAVPGARVQLPERDRARAVRALLDRARARRPHEPRRRRGRRELLVRAARPAGARAAARDLVGPPHATGDGRRGAARGDRAAARHPPIRAAPRRTRSFSRSRSARSRWWCSPVGVVSSRSARWRSRASAR